ncbi:adenylate/guanylate cyclase domain-containing protein [Roseibium sp.]|uniref:adenylate/guanylate cyclase domain-containing protein n=1 Tax=Roseibium sp. TaxID=1936156 RepID=UPI003D0F7CF5
MPARIRNGDIMAGDIKAWLEAIGLGKYGEAFADAEVDLDTLPLLAEEDLKELGLPLGPRRKLQKALAGLSGSEEAPGEQPEAAPRQPADERRQVTVLFADLSGFTRLSNELGSEETHALLNRYFNIVDAAVSTYGGKIDKHIGDAVMALFGAPIARTDDPVRALRAAADIHTGLRDLQTSDGHSLEAHIGIASGQVVAARTGSASFSEYTVTGETVNLASRLQDVAVSGETLITAEVYHSASHAAECAARGEIAVDGFERPIRVWSVSAVLEPEARSAPGPFVGREIECRQFQALAEQTAQERRGRSILVRGEPGIGKTMLVDRFLAIAGERGFTTHRGLVLDFGTGKGRDAIGALLRSLMGLSPAAGEDQRKDAVRHMIREGRVAETREVFLNDLLDLPQPVAMQGQYDAMDMEKRDEGKRATFAELARNLATHQPQVIVVEDIHWADEQTIGCLVQLASGLAEVPLLMIMTSRAEALSAAGSWSAALLNAVTTTMEVQPLSKAEALELARDLLHMDSAQAAAMAERSQGNPLFLDQLVRNASEDTDDLPGTIQSLVLARMDRLAPADREALQAASVIGQDFSREALLAVAASPGYDLKPLILNKLVHPLGTGFLFDHALVRDAVYSSLLTGRKRELHSRAAAYFSGFDPVLRAEHLERAGDRQAPAAFLAAAEAEAAAYRTERAHRLALQGLAIAQESADRFQLQCRTGEWELDLGLPTKARESFGKAAELAATDADICRVNIGLASALRLTDRQPEALALLEDTMPVALRTGHPDQLSRICHLQGNLMFILGKLEDCRSRHQKALEYAREAASPELEARALGGLADAAYAEGKLLTAYEQFSRCVALAEQSGLGRVAVVNRSMVAITQITTGDIEGALETTLEAIEAARKVGQDRAALVAHHGAHVALWYLGRSEEDRSHCLRALDMALRLGAQLFEAEALLFLSEVERSAGNGEAALDLARQSLEIQRRTDMKFLGPMTLAGLAFLTKDAGERNACLKEAATLIAAGSLSHNVMWFYRDAIELSLNLENWAEADRYADAYEAYGMAEPFPACDFFVKRCRTLAQLGRGNAELVDTNALRELHALAKTRYVPFAEKLELALEKMRTS